MKKTAFIIVLLFAVAGASAQNSLLWKITGKDLKEPSYIFGTVHMICGKDFFWTTPMQNSLEQTRQLCFEIPVNDSMFTETMKYSTLKDGKQLKDFFTPQQYDKVDAYFRDSLRTPLSVFANMKPFTILSLLIIKATGCGMQVKTYETEIAAKNKKDARPVIGLETVARQMAIIDQANQDSIATAIVSMTDKPQETRDGFSKLIDAYKKQDLDAIYAETMGTGPGNMSFSRKILIDDRNRAWIPEIIQIAAQTPTFFAVGAGHLPGENGVLQLLKDNGYTVTPVTQ